MKTKVFHFSLIIIFSIIFYFFYKGLQNSNIYSPETNIKKDIPFFKVKIFETKKFKINFEKVEKKDKENFRAIIGKFKIENSDGKIEILKPELRIYNQPNIVTSEADIKTNLLSDKFMTMNLVQNQDYFNIRYQIKPFMIWIWLSVLLISFGGLNSFFKKKNEK